VDATVATTVSNGPAAIDTGAAPTATPPTTMSKTCQSPSTSPGPTLGVGDTQPTHGGAAPDGGATTKGATTPPVAAVPSSDASSGTPNTAIKTGGGCSLGDGTSPGGLAMLLVWLGILGLLRARRSQG
jgi:MYXO-CTERM domain-containing protein